MADVDDQLLSKVEKELKERSEAYSKTPNYKKSISMFLYAERALRINEELARSCPEQLKDNTQFKLKTIFFLKANNTAISIHVLLRNCQYTQSYGGVRFLYDTYCLMRGLNQPDAPVDKIYATLLKDMDELQAQGGIPATFAFKYSDLISRVKQSEKDKIANREKMYHKMYKSLSEIASHPHRVDYAFKDGAYDPVPDDDVISLSISSLHGIFREYLKCIQPIGNQPSIQGITKLLDETAETLGDEIPTYIKD